MQRQLAAVPGTAQAQVTGGAPRVVRVVPDPDRLRTLSLSIGDLLPALQSAQAQLPAGSLESGDRRGRSFYESVLRSRHGVGREPDWRRG